MSQSSDKVNSIAVTAKDNNSLIDKPANQLSTINQGGSLSL